MKTATPRTEKLREIYAGVNSVNPNALIQEVQNLEIELADRQAKLDEANNTIKAQHELMVSAEKRGVDKATEEYKSQNLSLTTRIKELVEGLKKCLWALRHCNPSLNITAYENEAEATLSSTNPAEANKETK